MFLWTPYTSHTFLNLTSNVLFCCCIETQRCICFIGLFEESHESYDLDDF